MSGIHVRAGRGGSLLIFVLAQPGAATTRLGAFSCGGIPGGRVIEVRVAERAVDGQANAAVLRVLARAINIPHTALKLVNGGGARRKTVAVEFGAIEAPLLEARLSSLPPP